MFVTVFVYIFGNFMEETTFDRSLTEKISWLLTMAGFSILYLIFLGIVWNASRRIDFQTKEIIQSKKDWELTFNTIPDMVTIHDKNFTIIQANKTAKKMLKLPSNFHEPIQCYQYYHGKDYPPEGCPTCDCLRKEKTGTFETFEPHLDRYLEIRAMPRYDENNEFAGLIHVARDITDIKKTVEENKKLKEQFLQVQKMESLGRLAGGIAHDFNNLIFVITGYSALALKELNKAGTLRDHIIAIHEAGEKASALTNKLLAFSRKQVLEMKIINLNTTIENSIKMLRRLIPADVTLRFNPHTQVQKVLADRFQLEQVLLNLAVNARDAMPNGGNLVIETSDEIIEESSEDYELINAGAYIILSVKDTGIGMRKEVQNKIFEPFYSTKSHGKGTGMGLATVYGIIKQHKGFILVNSELGKGTEFKIYLPKAEGELEEIEIKASEESVTGNETILVVDDDLLVRGLIIKMLTPLGYNVLEASNGKEALEISNNYPDNIDLLLTDVIMPGMNGRELAELLLEERPETKVIFISGYTDDAIDHHGVLVPGIVLINKPIKEIILINKIREVLDRKNEEVCISHDSVDLKELHILLVDDDKDIRNLIQFFLKDSNCNIDHAENGKVALEKIKSSRYDLILMDMQMPIMDGETATKDIRRWEEENMTEPTPIIALSGFSDREHIEKCMVAGGTSYLSKPVKRGELIACLLHYVPSNLNKDNTGHKGKIIVRIDNQIKDLIPDYMKNRQDDITNINNALHECDFDTIRIVGHSMKGSGKGYGFDAISDIGLHLENAAIEKNTEKVKKYVAELSYYIHNIDLTY